MKSIIAIAFGVLAIVGTVQAAGEAGEAVLVTGRAFATDAAGKVRTLRKGDTLFAGDTISTERHSYINIEYRDGGRTLIAPTSQLKIEEYNFEPPARVGGPRGRVDTSTAAPAQGRSVLSLIRGSFRAVTGLIGRGSPQDYAIKTTVATIGIRGTDFIVVQCDEQCSAMGPVPDDTDEQGGTVTGVYEGAIGVTNAAGEERTLAMDEFLLVTREGQFVPLAVPPEFLFLTPMDDPKACD